MARSLNGIRMNVTQTAANGVVNARTIFEFSQAGDVVEARYSGGGIARGHLIGRFIDGRLEFRYVQLTDDGLLDGGHSTCDLDETADGRLRLREHFEWASRDGVGINVFEELKDA